MTGRHCRGLVPHLAFCGWRSRRHTYCLLQDRKKVPGEYLYQIEPGYFDRRMSPPEEQNLEKLYYQLCSVCGRASNDPACRCASTLSDQQRKRDRDGTHIQAP